LKALVDLYLPKKKARFVVEGKKDLFSMVKVGDKVEFLE
jgi:5S rRNA maturation endonuclease (ribonuclease M5)